METLKHNNGSTVIIDSDGNVIVAYNYEGDAEAGHCSAVSTDEGDAEGGDWSAVRTHVGDAKGGHYSSVRAYKGNAEGRDYSSVRTFLGKATCGDWSMAMGASVELGKNSVGGIVKCIEGDLQLVEVVVNGDVKITKYEDYIKDSKEEMTLEEAEKKYGIKIIN